MRAKQSGGMMRMLVLAAAVGLLIFSGCDTLEEGGLTLQEKEKTFRFEFSSSQLTAGSPTDIASRNQVDLTEELRSDGFTTAEVVSAQVSSAEMERVQPIGVSLSFLSQSTLRLTAGERTAEVASGSSFGSGSRANLTVQSGQDVTRFITAPVFRASLRVVPDQVPDNEDFVLTVTVRFRITVEGF